MAVNIGEVSILKDTKADKEQAKKILEEAAEVFGAWQEFDRGKGTEGALLSECADLIQATSNILGALGVKDFSGYMESCKCRNKARGRVYEDVKKPKQKHIGPCVQMVIYDELIQ